MRLRRTARNAKARLRPALVDRSAAWSHNRIARAAATPMLRGVNKMMVAGLAGAAVLAATLVLLLRWRPADTASSPVAPAPRAAVPASAPPANAVASEPRSRPAETAPPRGLSAEEKAARVAKIKRDYDDIRAKASADYRAAGTSFPGGLNAFLRQLALLEREKRADLAAVLTPRELEDLELAESAAGQLVQRLLGDTAATDEQRRAVFRLQRAFEDRFALTFDLTAAALFERETARQQVQEQIRAVLGDELFAEWLRGEGPEFGQLATFVAQQGLPRDAAIAVWHVRNDYTRRRLELTATARPAPDQRAAQAALALETESRLMAIVGQGALQAGRDDVFGWLPKK